jgi:RNA polymerase sigma factor (sigma-70 family)
MADAVPSARLNALIETYGALVLSRCRAFCRNGPTAEDLAQDVFARLCELSNRRDTPITGALVEGVMRKVQMEWLRRKRRLPRLIDMADEAADRQQPADADDPNEPDDRHLMIRSLVQKLTGTEQQVILGRHYLGMTMSELTDFLGMPRSTVTDCYQRAIVRLREMAESRGLWQ